MCGNVSMLTPHAFSTRSAISVDRPALPSTRSDSAARRTPSCSAARDTDKPNSFNISARMNSPGKGRTHTDHNGCIVHQRLSSRSRSQISPSCRVNVVRQLPEADRLQVPARLPVSWCRRQPGGPPTPSTFCAASSAVSIRRTQFARSGLISRASSCSTRRRGRR